MPSAVPLLSATATAAATSALPVHVTVDVLQYPILQHLPELVACRSDSHRASRAPRLRQPCARFAPRMCFCSVYIGLICRSHTRSYLLNPYTIATAVGMSTAGFVHASVALAVCSAIGGAFPLRVLGSPPGSSLAASSHAASRPDSLLRGADACACDCVQATPSALRGGWRSQCISM